MKMTLILSRLTARALVLMLLACPTLSLTVKPNNRFAAEHEANISWVQSKVAAFSLVTGFIGLVGIQRAILNSQTAPIRQAAVEKQKKMQAAQNRMRDEQARVAREYQERLEQERRENPGQAHRRNDEQKIDNTKQKCGVCHEQKPKISMLLLHTNTSKTQDVDGEHRMCRECIYGQANAAGALHQDAIGGSYRTAERCPFCRTMIDPEVITRAISDVGDES